MNFVAVGRIVFAQPGMFVGGPSIEIMDRLTWKHILPEVGPQGKEIVVQPCYEFWLRQGTDVWPDEGIVQKADDQGRMVGNQQPPSRMPASKRFERAIIHCSTRRGGRNRIPSHAPVPHRRAILALRPSPVIFSKRCTFYVNWRYCSLFVPMSRGTSSLFWHEAGFTVDITDRSRNGTHG